MGSLVGHVLPGFGFFLIGLWHLLNHIKLHVSHPISYTSSVWFQTPKFKYLELFLIMGGCIASISMELFIGPQRHQPLDPDGTIPTTHLHNFEHANISMTFLMYTVFAIILDKVRPPAQYGLTLLIGAVGFAQEFLLFHLHSTDHMGVEGQYHWLLQLIIVVSLISTLLGIGYPKSFVISFVRSLSIFFQGIWLFVIGIMLWTPQFTPKGCFLNWEEGHQIVRCHNHESLDRAKSLVNIEFSWYLVGVTTFGICLYLALFKMFAEKVEYQSLAKFENQEEQLKDDIENQKRNKSFFPVGKAFELDDMER